MEENKNQIIVSDIKDLGINKEMNQKIYTTIEDPKVLFNLDSNVDYKLNDCKGETIKVVDYLIRVIENEVLEDGKVNNKIITIIVDDKGKSYVTASKVFANQFIKAVNYFGEAKIKEGLIIQIKEVKLKNSSNKALGFELV